MVVSSTLGLAEALLYCGGICRRGESGGRETVAEAVRDPGTFWAWSPSVFPTSMWGSCPVRSPSRGLVSTVLTVRVPYSCPWPVGQASDGCPSCVCPPQLPLACGAGL